VEGVSIMIIRENGMVVGKLDDETMDLTDVESARLQTLVDDWRENGIGVLIAPEESVKGALGDSEASFEFDKSMLGAIENQLLIEGFDVQTA